MHRFTLHLGNNFHNHDIFLILSNKPTSIRKLKIPLQSPYWRMNGDWNIEHYEGLSMRSDVLQLASEINRIFLLVPNSFSLLDKKFRPWLHAERNRSNRLSSSYLKVIKIGLNFCCVSSFIRWLASMASNSPGKGQNQTRVSCKWRLEKSTGLAVYEPCYYVNVLYLVSTINWLR